MQNPFFENHSLSAAEPERGELFLSRLTLNPRHAKVRRDIADCHEIHRTLLAAFPHIEKTGGDKNARAEFGVLFRLELDAKREKAVVLIQSAVLPDWDQLPLGYLAETENDNPACKSIAENFAAIENETRLMFRLKANPTKRVGKNDAVANPRFRELKKRRRVEIYGETNQIEWLARKAETAGFRLGNVRVDADVANAVAQPNGKIYGKRLVAAAPESTAAKRETLTFAAVLFEGELVVTDADIFRQTLMDGIGQGKAYGFGLLSVARPLSF